ncbi:hypothetical protein PM082_004246 [Marasmius tenuissimus]|nr:hypothetical protein PM082_004246 [Marasmius tenuissimus]
MEDHQRLFTDGAIKKRDVHHFLHHLATYVLDNVPSDLDIFPLDFQEKLSRRRDSNGSSFNRIPDLLTSQDGRAMFMVISEHARQTDAQETYISAARSTWKLALLSVAHINELPLDYFSAPDSPQSSGSGACDSDSPSNAPLDDGSASSGDDDSMTNGGQCSIILIGPSSSTKDGKRDELPEEVDDLGDRGEWNADILERHLFNVLPTQ